jgi:hypothetical protein
MRKKFDYWGVPFSELFPNYHAPYTVECDAIVEKERNVSKAIVCINVQHAGKKYTLSYGDYILIDEKGKKR